MILPLPECRSKPARVTSLLCTQHNGMPRLLRSPLCVPHPGFQACCHGMAMAAAHTRPSCGLLPLLLLPVGGARGHGCPTWVCPLQLLVEVLLPVLHSPALHAAGLHLVEVLQLLLQVLLQLPALYKAPPGRRAAAQQGACGGTRAHRGRNGRSQGGGCAVRSQLHARQDGSPLAASGTGSRHQGLQGYRTRLMPHQAGVHRASGRGQAYPLPAAPTGGSRVQIWLVSRSYRCCSALHCFTVASS